MAMRNSKCKWCASGVVFDERTGAKVGSCYCDIDAYDAEIGCNEWCHYYQRKIKKEANDANA